MHDRYPISSRRPSRPALLHPLALALALLLLCQRAPAAPAPDWESSLVYLEVTRRAYEVFQPWTPKSRTVQKNGLVIGAREILTTAEELSDRTLVRVQRGGRGKWWDAEVVWRRPGCRSGRGCWSSTKRASQNPGRLQRSAAAIHRHRHGRLRHRRDGCAV